MSAGSTLQFEPGREVTTTYYSQTENIVELPDDALLHIFEHANWDDLPRLSSTCRTFNRIAWTVYWDRVFSFTDNCPNPQDTLLKKAAKRLEFFFLEDSDRNNELLGYFFDRIARRNVTSQVNFSSNIFRSIQPQRTHLSDPRYERLLLNLFNHPQSPMLCRMKVHQYAISMILPFREKFVWETEKSAFEGAKLSSYPKLSFKIVPYHIAEEMHISARHTFEEGEIVCVLDRGPFSLGKSSLFFGRISGKRGSSWQVSLEHDGNGTWSAHRLKKAVEIAKIPLKANFSELLSSPY